MKKIILFTVIILGSLLTSCIKERTCSCADGRVYILKDTKRRAKKDCDSYSSYGATVNSPSTGYPQKVPDSPCQLY